MAEGLEAAVRVHAVHQAICRGNRACGLYNYVQSGIFAYLSLTGKLQMQTEAKAISEHRKIQVLQKLLALAFQSNRLDLSNTDK